MKKTDNQMLIIFGASGDLTARKLIPAIFNLYKGNHLPDNFVVLGVSRSDLGDLKFRSKVVLESTYLKKDRDENEEEYIQKFADKLFYEDLGSDYNTSYERLEKRIADLDQKCGTDGNHIFYLSTPPSLYEPIAKNLSANAVRRR